MSTARGVGHYRRGTVAVGIVLLMLTGIYAAQVASVVRDMREILASPLPAHRPDGGMQFDLRTFAIHDFFFTSQAWGVAHLWLLCVAAVQFLRHPQQRVGLVRSLAAVLLSLVVATWIMAVWLGRHGTSV